MSARLGVLHAWIAQLHALLPEARVTRVRGLALFSVGMIWAGTVRVNRVAAALPLGVRVPSTERRLRRFLANPARDRRDVVAAAAAAPAGALGGPGGGAGLRSDAPSRRAGRCCGWASSSIAACCRCAGGWCPSRSSWPETLAALLPALLAPIAAALPAGCQVTLLGDRGVAGPDPHRCRPGAGLGGGAAAECGRDPSPSAAPGPGS